MRMNATPGIINLRLTVDESKMIRRCPFCGERERLSINNTHTASYWVSCDGCGAEVHGESFGKHLRSDQLTLREHKLAKKSALAAWNRRDGER